MKENMETYQNELNKKMAFKSQLILIYFKHVVTIVAEKNFIHSTLNSSFRNFSLTFLFGFEM